MKLDSKQKGYLGNSVMHSLKIPPSSSRRCHCLAGKWRPEGMCIWVPSLPLAEAQGIDANIDL